jgi:hypothetical protein
MKRASMVVAAALAVGASGCSSVGGSAVRTSALAPPPHGGVVALYASGVVPQGALPVGVVEVHASEGEATIEALLPLFVRRVSQLGGTIAVLDSTDTRFDIAPVPHTESYAVPCGYRGMCFASRTVFTNAEIMTLTLRGRAFVTGATGTTGATGQGSEP